MKKISSDATFYYKLVFPAIWFGLLSAFSIIMFLSNGITVMLFVPITMAIFGYLLMSFLVFGVINEVYDDGDSILFRHSGKEVRVKLVDIKTFDYLNMNPPKVTLGIAYQTELGKRLSYMPNRNFPSIKKNPEVLDLDKRIKEAKKALKNKNLELKD